MILRILAGIAVIAVQSAVCNDAITYLDDSNHDNVIKNNRVVFVAFCADWCPFSQRLKPIFEESARVFKAENPTASVAWAIVDSVQHANIADKYYVSKYPTMKIFINGELVSREYRSTRSVEALTAFVKQKFESSIKEFNDQDELEKTIDRAKRNMLAKIKDKSSIEFDNLQKAASILHDDCVFWFTTGDALDDKSDNNFFVVFIDPNTDDQQKFDGDFSNYDILKQWLTDKCIPLIREVTFENVEELTEEGLPFLIFFRNPADKEADKLFTELVIRELHDQKTAINSLLADGHKFAHPLKHLGKAAKDLPVLAIDSFQHMFLFPDMKDLPKPGKLRQFVLDLHSGKLHKDFHANLDQKVVELQKLVEENPELYGDTAEPEPPAIPSAETSPPPSVFKHLKPSKQRYSLLRKTEL